MRGEGDVEGAREWGRGRGAPRPPRARWRGCAAGLSPPLPQIGLMGGWGTGVAHRGWVKDADTAVDHPRWSPPAVKGGPTRERGGGVAMVRGQTQLLLTRGGGSTARMHIVTAHPPHHLCLPFLLVRVTPCSSRRVLPNRPPVRRSARVASGAQLPPRRAARAHTHPVSTTADPMVGVTPASSQSRPDCRGVTRLNTGLAPTGSERPALGPSRRASTVFEAAAGNPTRRPHRGAAAAARGHRRGGAARGGGGQAPSAAAPAVAAAISRPLA